MPHPVVAFAFSRVGPVEDCGEAEELVEAPEAIEMPVVLCQEARCTGDKDFVRATEDFATGGTGTA